MNDGVIGLDDSLPVIDNQSLPTLDAIAVHRNIAMIKVRI
jgi:hypothetical protein